MNRTKLTLAVSIIALVGFVSPTSTAQNTWSPEQVVWSSTLVGTVHAADLDGDSNLDLVMSSSQSGGMLVWAKNNGDGSFQTPVALAAAEVRTRGIKAADINNDGDIDLVLASRDRIRSLLGAGPGAFALGGDIDFLQNGWFSDVETADLDLDGDLDIVAISIGQAGVGGFIAYYENLGGGAFGSRQVVHSLTPFPGTNSPPHGQIDIANVATASSPAPDILFASPVDGTFGYLRNNSGTYNVGGTPISFLTFFPATILESGVTDPSDIRAADLDNDGDLDIVAAPLRFYEANSFGFTTGQPIAAVAHVHSMDLADLDLDGMVDIVTNANNTVSVIHGLGGGVFASPAFLSNSSGFSRTVVAADLSGNGYPDVAAARSNPGTVRVTLNEGPSLYSGSGGDLDLLTGINDAASSEPRIKNAAAGDALTVAIRSQSAYIGLPPVLVGDFFSTGSPPVGPAGFPDLHVNVNTVFALFDGFSTTGAFGPTVLHPGGLQLQFTIPPALAGSSLMLQALVGAPGPSNIFFTVTNGHEIRVGL